MAASDDPLETAFAPFAADGVPTFVVGTPTGAGRVPLTVPLAERHERFAALVARHGDRRLAAAYLGSWIVQVPMLLIGLPTVLAGVAPVVELDDLSVHPHEDGWFDVRAVAPRSVQEVSDPGDAAATIVATTTPLVGPLAADLPVGRPALWGAAADALAGMAMLAARVTARDPSRVWERVDRLLDGVAAEVGRLVRPSPLPVTWSGGCAWFITRGTCCQYYRTQPGADPAAEGYCSTCPLRTEGSGARRIADHLDALTG